MSRDRVRALVAEYCRRVWNEHDVGAIDELCPPTTLLLNQSAGPTRVTRAELGERVSSVLRMMPDHRLEIGTVVAGDDEVVFQWRTTGNWIDRARGAFAVDFGGMTYWRIETGRIAARDGLSDVATFVWQTKVHRRRLSVLVPV